MSKRRGSLVEPNRPERKTRRFSLRPPPTSQDKEEGRGLVENRTEVKTVKTRYVRRISNESTCEFEKHSEDSCRIKDEEKEGIFIRDFKDESSNYTTNEKVCAT